MFKVKKIFELDTDLKLLVFSDLHSLEEENLRLIKDIRYDACFLLGDISDLY